MIQLTKKEQEGMLNLSKEFVSIHQEILQVEKTIRKKIRTGLVRPY